jgi:hypothetical protein
MRPDLNLTTILAGPLLALSRMSGQADDIRSRGDIVAKVLFGVTNEKF